MISSQQQIAAIREIEAEGCVPSQATIDFALSLFEAGIEVDVDEFHQLIFIESDVETPESADLRLEAATRLLEDRFFVEFATLVRSLAVIRRGEVN